MQPTKHALLIPDDCPGADLFRERWRHYSIFTPPGTRLVPVEETTMSTKAQCTAQGCPPEVADAAAAAGIPFALLLTLVAKYGPALWAILSEILAALPKAPVSPAP